MPGLLLASPTLTGTTTPLPKVASPASAAASRWTRRTTSARLLPSHTGRTGVATGRDAERTAARRDPRFAPDSSPRSSRFRIWRRAGTRAAGPGREAKRRSAQPQNGLLLSRQTPKKQPGKRWVGAAEGVCSLRVEREAGARPVGLSVPRPAPPRRRVRCEGLPCQALSAAPRMPWFPLSALNAACPKPPAPGERVARAAGGAGPGRAGPAVGRCAAQLAPSPLLPCLTRPLLRAGLRASPSLAPPRPWPRASALCHRLNGLQAARCGQRLGGWSKKCRAAACLLNCRGGGGEDDCVRGRWSACSRAGAPPAT